MADACIARRDDIAAIVDIYNAGIAARVATFETEPRTVADITGWFDAGDLITVATFDNTVGAFARTSQYRSRPCYEPIREFSVYTGPAFERRGLATCAMQLLMSEAEKQGVTKLISRIFPQNTASLALCDRLGFRRVGIYKRHGKLDGQWRDCVIVERLLGEALR